ncbi:PilZ domain-containing protein [Colwelliaceae bacterium MEBiC 14330]
MNKDFSKYHKIIKSFRGEVGKSSFEANYNAATKQLNKNERFLLKMELKRLAAPCSRAIDLRGLVDGECQIFDYKGQSHFLDEVAIQAFNEMLAIYGSYTFGVYEAVKDAKNSFRNLYHNEKMPSNSMHGLAQSNKSTVEKLQYPAKLELLTNYANREEERMNFATAITLSITDKLTVTTTSVDISVKGIKFKLIKEANLYEGEQLTITFTGLEQEFQFNKNISLTYEVMNVLRDSDTQLIGCRRIAFDENDGFERFLAGYIQGNKRRYKINLDNSLTALQTRGFEQFTLVKFNELAVFMHSENNDITSVIPRYALTNRNNYRLYQYWQDEKKQSTLDYLINPARFKRLVAMQKQGKSLLVFSFIHQHKGHKFFYTIDEQQFDSNSAFFRQFLAFAASKKSFAVTALNYHPVKAEQAYSPYTLSSAITKQQHYLNPPLSDEVLNILASLPFVVTVTDMTASTNVDEYQALGYEGIDLERLKNYGHKQGENANQLDEITANYGHQRQEVRFKFKTPAIIECEEVTWSGYSADFSVSGLKIELEAPAALVKGDIVYLSFPNLQKITSTYDLKQLPYRVMRVSKDKTVINLRVSVKEHQHIGRSFFRLLIDKNKDKLTPDEYAMLTPGLSSALRTVYGVNMAIPTAVVQSSGSRYKVETLVAGQHGYHSPKNLLAAMSHLSDRNGYYNLYPVLGHLQVRNILDQQMKKLLSTDVAIDELVYIGINSRRNNIEDSVQIKLASELNTPELTNFFIKKSLKQGGFYSVQLKLSRSEAPHMEHLNPELSYISAYAIHRGKQLEQEIYSVAGLIQLVDVTQETLFRYGLVNNNKTQP